MSDATPWRSFSSPAASGPGGDGRDGTRSTRAWSQGSPEAERSAPELVERAGRSSPLPASLRTISAVIPRTAIALVVFGVVAFGAGTAATIGLLTSLAIGTAGGGVIVPSGPAAVSPFDAPVSGRLGAPTAPLVVDVAGAVAVPGLHRLTAGSRVGDAIEAAGGFSPRADLEDAARRLNLAAPVADGAKVYVPALGRSAGGSADDGRVDLNRADQAALEALPGVGPVTARRIIDARSEAPFETIEDLRLRGIVGQRVFEDLHGLVRIGA